MEHRAIILLLTISVVSALDDDMAELAKVLRENCGEETGLDLAIIEEINKGADLTPDPKLKCYIKCIMETAGMMSEGEVDQEAVLAILPEDMKAKIESVIHDCGTKKGADDCDTAYLTHVCWQKANKKDYFLV